MDLLIAAILILPVAGIVGLAILASRVRREWKEQDSERSVIDQKWPKLHREGHG